MAASNFSIVNGADGSSKIPISTPVNDASGNTVVAHLGMVNVGGVATPVSASNPEPVTVTNFPATQTVAGAVSVGNLPAIVSTGTPLPVADAQSAAFQGVASVTPGSTVSPQRSLGYVCTVPGNITITLPDGSTITLPIQTGGGAFQTLPFAVTNLALGSGTAGTFWNLK